MANRIQMHPDLMGAAGFKPAAQLRPAGPVSDREIIGLGRFSARDDGHARAVHRMAADRGFHRARACHGTVYDGNVVASNRSCLQLAHQIDLGGNGFGDDEKSAGILVETMHDARPRHPGQRRGMAQKRIEQGAAPVAAAGMDHQAGRLVDYENVRVLEQDRQRNLLGGMLGARR